MHRTKITLSSQSVIIMTCYFRHIKDIFVEIGVEVTKENKREIDKKIHELLGIEYKRCSSTWREFKRRLEEDEFFIDKLRNALADFR